MAATLVGPWSSHRPLGSQRYNLTEQTRTNKFCIQWSVTEEEIFFYIYIYVDRCDISDKLDPLRFSELTQNRLFLDLI